MTTKKAAGSASRRPEAAKPQNTPKKHALTPAMEARKWKPGQSGNPGGRPKRDRAAEIAQACFEEAPEAIKKQFLKKLKKGDPKAFQVLADRAYGKPHQQVDVDGAVAITVILDL